MFLLPTKYCSKLFIFITHWVLIKAMWSRCCWYGVLKMFNNFPMITKLLHAKVGVWTPGTPESLVSQPLFYPVFCLKYYLPREVFCGIFLNDFLKQFGFLKVQINVWSCKWVVLRHFYNLEVLKWPQDQIIYLYKAKYYFKTLLLL